MNSFFDTIFDLSYLRPGGVGLIWSTCIESASFLKWPTRNFHWRTRNLQKHYSRLGHIKEKAYSYMWILTVPSDWMNLHGRGTQTIVTMVHVVHVQRVDLEWGRAVYLCSRVNIFFTTDLQLNSPRCYHFDIECPQRSMWARGRCYEPLGCGA